VSTQSIQESIDSLGLSSPLLLCLLHSSLSSTKTRWLVSSSGPPPILRLRPSINGGQRHNFMPSSFPKFPLQFSMNALRPQSTDK
jgi:hypothetical protein